MGNNYWPSSASTEARWSLTVDFDKSRWQYFKNCRELYAKQHSPQRNVGLMPKYVKSVLFTTQGKTVSLCAGIRAS